MATLTIRNVDDDLKASLRMRAARHGQSMEEEVRSILRQVLTQADRFAVTAADFSVPPRTLPRAPLDWDDASGVV